MARMPGTNWLGEHSPQTVMSRYDIVCIHTIVGYAPAHAAHFSTHHDGRIDQSRDTKYRSGANLNGNHRIIAIENEDHGSVFGSWNVDDGHAVPAFTDAQIEAIAQICAWAHQVHGIPLVACPNSKPESRGIAYHRQGIDGDFSTYAYPGRVSGGEVWTLSTGKVCPGDRRIRQTLEEIIPRAKEISEGDNVTEAEMDQLLAKMWAKNVQVGDALEPFNRAIGRTRNALQNKSTTELSVEHASLAVKVDALSAKVDNIATGDIDYDLLASKVVERMVGFTELGWRYVAEVPPA